MKLIFANFVILLIFSTVANASREFELASSSSQPNIAERFYYDPRTGNVSIDATATTKIDEQRIKITQITRGLDPQDFLDVRIESETSTNLLTDVTLVYKIYSTWPVGVMTDKILDSNKMHRLGIMPLSRVRTHREFQLGLTSQQRNIGEKFFYEPRTGFISIEATTASGVVRRVKIAQVAGGLDPQDFLDVQIGFESPSRELTEVTVTHRISAGNIKVVDDKILTANKLGVFGLKPLSIDMTSGRTCIKELRAKEAA